MMGIWAARNQNLYYFSSKITVFILNQIVPKSILSQVFNTDTYQNSGYYIRYKLSDKFRLKSFLGCIPDSLSEHISEIAGLVENGLYIVPSI